VSVDPGSLRTRLEYLALVETPDGEGGYSADWVKQFDIWASLRPKGTSTPEEASTRQAATAFEIIVRKRDDIAPANRFRLGERLFDIDTVFDPDETGRYLACRCRETR
jgi:SPP1 family predicted phage head-tail adaptor